ncbi:MAG: YigZ family protein [Candidatus Zixiibacteriota bacterium]|nr:MAG: YigZ family protein [candidate division Zixibacteria bacterium]
MRKKSNSDGSLRIKEKCRHEEKVKDSRFIATAIPVNDEKEANTFIAEIKKEFHDASHNCSAWRIGRGNKSIYRYNDDGEPSGTGGRPILKAIEIRELSDICIVVTRYFGGTKLGTGGLSRAYGQLATELLKKCEIEKKYVTNTLEFSVGFDFVGVVHNIIDKFKVDLKDSQYGDDVLFIVEVRSTAYTAFMEKLTEATNGQVQFK